MSSSNDPKKIRIGVMGCAGIAQRYMIPAILDTQDLELVAVASRTLEKAKAYADRFGGDAVEGYENLLNRRDIDAVYVPLPTGLHEQWILLALQMGKHVFAEKSLAMNVVSAQRMLNLAKENGLVLM